MFDKWHANDACDFMEKLPHVEGNWKNPDGSDQKTIVLHDSDVFFVVQLFGFRNLEGGRRFTSALKCIARKNAKSTIAAGIGLYCETCEDETGPQVITGATTGDQARIVFNVAKRMVEKTSALREAFGMEPFANAIACYNNGGTFKPINAKASTQDGLNPSVVILDEVHAHKTHDLLNVLTSAAGARANPLFLYTTTEGYETPGPWPETRRFAEQVLDGMIDADHFLAVIYCLDEEDKEAGIAADDDFDESAWIKANPLMDVNPLLIKEIRKAAIEAKAMPGRHAEFKIKRLNRRAAAAGAWVDVTAWKKCGAAAMPSDHELAKLPCFGGLDLASVRDIASFRLVWDGDGVFYTKGWRFVPVAQVRHRTSRGLVPYAAWVNSGHLIEAGDGSIDHDVIAETILQQHKNFSILGLGYDTWNAAQIAKRLTDDGVPMIPFIQGPKSYSPAMKGLERAYIDTKLVHGDDPVLNWCMSNMVARVDQNLNSAPDKRRSADKIDDGTALLMAWGVMVGELETAEPSLHFF